jgi:hypothetical protein
MSVGLRDDGVGVRLLHNASATIVSAVTHAFSSYYLYSHEISKELPNA